MLLAFNVGKRGRESKNVGSLLKVAKVKGTGPTLVVWWLRICLPVQERQVRSLIRGLRSLEKLLGHNKDPTQPK